MQMKIVSVNVGEAREIVLGRHRSRSGIDKRPVGGRVPVGAEGLDGDRVLNRKYHGGPDQAVYVYTLEDYDAFAERLGEVPAPGTFGENLTVSGLVSADVRIGTRLHFTAPGAQGQDGEGLVLEVTAPRIPCATFAAHLGDAGFVKVFRGMGRPGLYARVLRSGTVGAGDILTVEPGDAAFPTVGEEFELHYDARATPEALHRSLAAPIAARVREEYLSRLKG